MALIPMRPKLAALPLGRPLLLPVLRMLRSQGNDAQDGQSYKQCKVFLHHSLLSSAVSVPIQSNGTS